MGSDKSDKDELDDIPHERKEPRPDFSKPLPPKALPKALQDNLNLADDESSGYWDSLYEGT